MYNAGLEQTRHYRGKLMVQKLCDCECHKSYDFWRTCCGDAGIKEGDEATNPTVPQVCSKDLLRRTEVLEAIGSIDEYCNPILFRRELAIAFLNKEISPDIVDDLVEMVIDLMRVAVKRTKQEITMKTHAL